MMLATDLSYPDQIRTARSCSNINAMGLNETLERVNTDKPIMMQLDKISFLNSAFSALDEPERVFFLRLAHIHNDLRHITHLLTREHNSLAASPPEEIVQQIILHQEDFAIRLWNGTLVEAWKVIERTWFARQKPKWHVPSGHFDSPRLEDAVIATKKMLCKACLVATASAKQLVQ